MKRDETFSRVDAVLLILLAGLVALFFWRILTPNLADRAQFPPGDFTDQFYAFRVYTTRAFAEGRIPLWSENFNSGHPFLADIQSQVFYPPAFVNTVLNLALYKSFSLFALEIEALLHFYLAGAFTYLFARRVIQNRIGAFTSAIVFMFGGYLTSYPSLQLAILETAAWLPVALYCLERAMEEGRFGAGRSGEVDEPLSRTGWTWLIAAGLALGVAATAGHPQTFLFVVAVCVLYLARREAQARGRWDMRTAGRVLGESGLLLSIAFGIAAIQLIPAMEYQQLSTREALSFADAAKGFPTLDILQFILPGYASAFASPLYVGIVPLWLAIFALAQGRARSLQSRIFGRGGISDAAFWGLVALGSLILSFGFYVFAYVLFYLFVPGAALFRDQERLAFVVSFALAMLAGYGMRDLINGFEATRAKKLYALLPAGAAMMLALLLAFFVAGTQNTEGRVLFLGDRAGLMLLLFGLASLVVGLYLRKVILVKWFVPLAIALILLDLWSVNEPANKGAVQDRFADIPFSKDMSRELGNFRVTADEQVLPGHFGIVTELEEIGGISPLRLARYDALLKLPAPVFLPLLNAQYAFSRTSEPIGGQVLSRDEGIALVQLPAPQPRAWLVGSAVVEPDDARAAEMLGSGFDFRQKAIVATEPRIALDRRATQGKVAVVKDEPENIVLVAGLPADGLVVVSENFYPGWRATVDGQPAEILRADLTLRAIAVPAGQHQVEMWYEPFSFKLGAGISALALLGCVGGILFLQIAKNSTRVVSSRT